MREFYKAKLAIRQTEQALKDLIPVLHQINDELGESLTWPEHWYLNQTAFTLYLDRRDIVSALRRSPIKDSARLKAPLHIWTQEFVSTLREDMPLRSVYTYCDKFALLAESAR